MSHEIKEGSPAVLGASWDGEGTNFALFSANASKVELCLFDSTGQRETDRVNDLSALGGKFALE